MKVIKFVTDAKPLDTAPNIVKKIHWIAGHKTECRSPTSTPADGSNVPVIPPPYKISFNGDGSVTERRMISIADLEKLAAYERENGVSLLGNNFR
jgi:hypothetical protein